MRISGGREELSPLESGWGAPPRYSLLDPGKALVFDFGSEAYAWCGRNASFALRAAACRLVKQVRVGIMSPHPTPCFHTWAPPKFQQGDKKILSGRRTIFKT